MNLDNFILHVDTSINMHDIQGLINMHDIQGLESGYNTKIQLAYYKTITRGTITGTTIFKLNNPRDKEIWISIVKCNYLRQVL